MLQSCTYKLSACIKLSDLECLCMFKYETCVMEQWDPSFLSQQARTGTAVQSTHEHRVSKAYSLPRPCAELRTGSSFGMSWQSLLPAHLQQQRSEAIHMHVICCHVLLHRH